MLIKKEIYELDYVDFREFVTKGFEEGYGKSATEAYEEFEQNNPDKAKEINMDTFLKITEDDYKNTIQMAVRQGKPVPEDILKEYPEFAKEKLELMKIRINRKMLLKALANMKSIVSGRHTLAILSSILISAKNDSIEIMATDLETVFHGIYPVKVISPGSIAISHKELSSFMSKTKSEEISIEEKEKKYVTVSGGSISLDIFCMDADDFPLLPEGMNCKKTMEIDSLCFKKMIAKTVIINPTREIDMRKSYIIGTSFKITKERKQNYLKAASTNGGVLAEIKEKISVKGKAKTRKDVLVPKSGLRKLNSSFFKDVKKQKAKGENKGFGLLDSSKQILSFTVKNDFFIVQKQNETIAMRLLEGDFPDYQDVINRDENKFVITANRNILLDAMKQMATMQDSNYCKMRVNIETNILKMIFVNPDIGEMKKNVIVKYDGGPLETMYCPSQFVDFLSLMKSGVVNLDIVKDVSLPCLITGDQDKDTIFAIMPWLMD